ncbi:hypothetical protein CKAH01_09700 [Colletotrichum kahawae]|uniref:Uncharacterized protein n=1 Tax=Colletotrichum kahawae TaxID=34407 RepID=A0AAD9XZB6_COLKA|nr:hypothetical protein CKAH01_09700 [Colletotrichum kahawae]
MDVVWTGQYALNWISHVPADGTRLDNLNGNWQPCRLGESYSLHRTGDWDKVSISGPPGTNTIEVSGNNYARVHIVMGLQRSEPSGETAWLPIFIDRSELAKGGHRRYELDQRVKVWFGMREPDSTMMPSAEPSSPAESTVEKIGVNKTEVWLRFDTIRRKWETVSP